MTDFFDETFKELDNFYPGSRRKRREPVKYIEPSFDASVWEDEYQIKHLPNGNPVQMYTIGSLAKALNRSVKTIRAWIDWGYFPPSPYRMPSVTSKKGKVYAGRRLYSKKMVEATVELFASAGILLPNRVDWSLHRDLYDKLADAWEKIRAEETSNTNKGK